MYTSARMKEIEDGAIVDGDVVSGNLILRRFDGTEINAGPIDINAGDLNAIYMRINERPRSPMQAAYGGAFTGPNVVAAAAGGSAVDLPPIACADITTPMLLPGGTVLRGVKGKTVFKAAGGASKNLIQNADAGGFTLEDITFDGNKANITSGVTGHAVNVLTAAGILIKGCLFKNTRLGGCDLTTINDVEIFDNRFEGCGDPPQNGTFRTNGVTIVGHNVRIKKNYFIGTNGHCVSQGALAAGQTSGMLVSDNVMLGTGGSMAFGVALGSFAINCDVLNNHIDGAVDNAIDTGSAKDVLIDGNTCLNSGFDGIDIDMSQLGGTENHLGIVITNNRIRQSGRWAIVVYFPILNSTGLIVSNNQIRRAGLNGINLSNVSRSVISDNTICDHSYSSPYFAAISLANTSRHNLISGNVAYELQTSPSQAPTGYSDDATCDYNTLSHNNFAGCAAAYNNPARANDIRANNRPNV